MTNDSSDRVEGDLPRVYLLAFPAHFSQTAYDLQNVGALLARWWKVLVALAFVGFGAGYGLSFLAAKQYEAETVLVVVDTGGDSGLFGSVLSGLGAGAAMSALGIGMPENVKSEALAYLRSREFAEKTIRKYKLEELLSRRGFFGHFRRSARPVEFEELIDKFVKESLAVAENRAAGTVSVSVRLPDREVVAVVASGMVRDLNLIMRARVVQEAERSISFLNAEVDQVSSVAVKEAIYKLVESQLKRRMIASVREDYVFRVVDPARPPDERRKSSPRRSLWAMAGLLLGGLIGTVVMLMVSRRRARVVHPRA